MNDIRVQATQYWHWFCPVCGRSSYSNVQENDTEWMTRCPDCQTKHKVTTQWISQRNTEETT